MFQVAGEERSEDGPRPGDPRGGRHQRGGAAGQPPPHRGQHALRGQIL